MHPYGCILPKFPMKHLSSSANRSARRHPLSGFAGLQRRAPLICAASVALLAVFHAGPAGAADGTWSALSGGSATGLWSDPLAWSGGIIADGAGSTAFFNTLDITGASVIHLDSARTIGNLLFGDADATTGANWALDNNGNAGNILTLSGAAPTISFGPTNAVNTLTISAVLAGTSGVTYAGTGTILMLGGVGHTYTGGTVLKTRLETTNVANANLTVFGSAVATNTLTFDGGYFKIFNTTGAPSAGGLVNNLIVNTTGTLEYSGRSFSNGTLTGSGTLNVVTHFVRADNGGNWSGFTGTVNVSSGDAGISDFRQTTYNGLAGATLNLGTNSNMYFTINQTNTAVAYAGTNVSIGALAGASSGFLRGGPIGGRVTNFLIGAKNVDSDFAGAIVEQAVGALTDVLKQGAGTQTFSGGSSAYNGPTRVDAGTLAVAVLADGSVVSSIGQSSNAAASLLLNGGTFKYIGGGHSTNRLLTVGTTGAVTIDASGSGAVNFTATGALTLSGVNTARTLTFAGGNTGSNIFSLIIPPHADHQRRHDESCRRFHQRHFRGERQRNDQLPGQSEPRRAERRGRRRSHLRRRSALCRDAGKIWRRRCFGPGARFGGTAARRRARTTGPAPARVVLPVRPAKRRNERKAAGITSIANLSELRPRQAG